MNRQGKWLPTRPNERTAVLLAFGWFFCLMSCYFILRPIRESLGSGLGSDQIQYLFLYTFGGMLLIAPVYSAVVARTSRIELVVAVYGFLALNIVLFAAMLGWSDDEIPNGESDRTSGWISRVYFVWVSVFSLFTVSLFWSVLADLFSNEQGKRLFGPIASGGTIGALGGSTIAGWLTQHLGLGGLLLVSAVWLVIGVGFAISLVHKIGRPNAGGESVLRQPLPGVWTGLFEIARSPFLIGICIYLALMSLAGTMVYLIMADVVRTSIPDPEQKTAFFAQINFWVQAGTLVVQTTLVGPLMRYWGVGAALMILPLLYLTSFVVIGFHAGLATLALIDVARRIAVYGFTAPSREVLFTVVSRQAKYKSKNFIDTVVYRGSPHRSEPSSAP